MTLNLFTKVMEHHAPLSKRIVKQHPDPWTDNELSKAFMEGSKAKVWQNYKKLKLNRKKRRLPFTRMHSVTVKVIH